MKNLLAEEMSGGIETERRAPSVIARLMGFDGLPPQQPVHKQPKKSLENHQVKVASVVNQRIGPCSGRRSFRKSSNDELEFKDVFEVSETSKPGSRSSSFRESPNSKITEAEMAFIRQKFMDAKRLSTDEKLQGSQEFHDALEALDSNKDLFVRFLQQPDSLFTRHMHDLQGTPPQSHCGRLEAAKSSDIPKNESSSLGSKPERESAWKNHSKYPHRHGLSSRTYSGRTSHSSLKSSKIQLEEKTEPDIAPTRIVVLKPNLGKAHNASKAAPLQHYSHAFPSDCRKHTGLQSIKNREAELSKRRNFSNDVGCSRHKSRESRDIAKAITRRMRNNINMGSLNFSSSGLGEYTGEESSCNMSVNDSNYDSEAHAVTYRTFFDRSNRNKASSSRSTGSSVSREAKKRLSERWKLTNKSQDKGGISRGSTLGEMLAVPDLEARLGYLDPVIREESFSEKFVGDDGSERWVEPLGISSRDGWKDGCITNLSRSRSLPASSAAFGSPKTSMCRETVCTDRYTIPKEASKIRRNKVVKSNYDENESARPRNSRSRNKKSHSSRRRGRNGDISTETNFSRNQVEVRIEEEDSLMIRDLEVSDLSYHISLNTSSVPDSVVDAGQEDTSTSSKSPDRDLSAHLVVISNSSAGDLENPFPQELPKEPSEEFTVPMHHTVPGLESPTSSKEADQPSPLSVLEAPFTDDLSASSECFESLSADLNGLRMQLQLLKLESEPYEEGTMIVSSDEDVGEEPVGLPEENKTCSPVENWESSYIHDVLIESGFINDDPDMFLPTRHSPECLVSPSIFEELEKNCEQTPWLRSNRKLLFDRINSGLMEIYQKHADPHPWTSIGTAFRAVRWTREGLERNLHKLLADEEQLAIIDDTTEKVLARDSQWSDFGDEFRDVGREIERVLIDELVNELVTSM